MSTWECLYYALVCCLGSHTLKWSVGVVFVGPNTILAIGEKLLLSAAHWTVRWGHRTVQCPCSVRLAVRSDTSADRWRCRLLHRTVHVSHRTIRWFSPWVPPGTSHWATVPWCIRQYGALSQTVHRGHTIIHFLDFAWYLLIFLWS
jgi:hypothetical protein